MRFFLPLLCVFGFLITACHPEEDITTNANAKLEFSSDRVFFDTIFTSIGSVTRRLRVYNPNKKAVTISSIELGGKAASPYKIIVNGLETFYTSNFYLRGGDSIYILVKVTIDPQNQSLPFLVSDSITFNTNGNIQKVNLTAYGQDAAFLNSETLPCNTTWTNTKPFVITNFVHVAAGCTLTIEKGVRVYFHDNAQMNVGGTLIVNGEKDSIVTFSGDKFYTAFENLPGQWDGITFSESSKNNSFNWVVIKNGLTGITVLNDPSDTDTIAEIKLSNSIIKNMQGSCIEGYGTDTYVYNCLFTNSVREAFTGIGGGNYHFKNCTFANYAFEFFRESAAVRFSNTLGITGALKARLTNCIVWGDQSNELSLNDDGINTFDFVATNCILKTTRTDQNINGNIINADPKFVSAVSRNFHLQPISPAIDAGIDVGILEDLDGKSRDSNPDIGAYEK